MSLFESQKEGEMIERAGRTEETVKKRKIQRQR
jgi:hypothetical protein